MIYILYAEKGNIKKEKKPLRVNTKDLILLFLGLNITYLQTAYFTNLTNTT